MKTLTLSILLLLFISCNDDDSSNEVFQGIYSGQFTVNYLDNSTHTGNVTVTFNQQSYDCTANANRIPAGGSGTFEIFDSTVKFADENIWTTDFDGNLILAGEYQYSQNGNSLLLNKELENIGTYRYELEKQ